jgi:hypothetical protein
LGKKIMNARRNWKLIERCLLDGLALLPEAARDNPEGGSKANFHDYIAHNEFGLALDELEGLGHFNRTAKPFWNCLWNAARFMELDLHLARYSEIQLNWPRSEAERQLDAEVERLIGLLHDGSEDEVEALASPYNGSPLMIFYSRSLSAINVTAREGDFALRLDGVTKFPKWVGDADVTLETKIPNKTLHPTAGNAPV